MVFELSFESVIQFVLREQLPVFTAAERLRQSKHDGLHLLSSVIRHVARGLIGR